MPRKDKNCTRQVTEQPINLGSHHSTSVNRGCQGRFEDLTMEGGIDESFDFSRVNILQDPQFKCITDSIGYQRAIHVPSSTAASAPCYALGHSGSYNSSNGYDGSSNSAFRNPSTVGMTLFDPMASYLTSYNVPDEANCVPWWPNSGHEVAHADSASTATPFLSWDGIMDDIEFNPWFSETESSTTDQSTHGSTTTAPEVTNFNISPPSCNFFIEGKIP